MYLGLFLAPWMLMYALSTIVMNHRAAFREGYGGELVRWQIEQERQLGLQFSADATPAFMAAQIMRELELDGNHNVNRSRDGKKLTILRTDPLAPRRISYTPEDGKLVIEKQELRTQPFLESLHRRRGFQSSVLLDDLWGGVVDLVIIAMVFWVLSGLWMWWELKVTRRAGALVALSGIVLFTLFLFRI
jgi:hypothetical protein